MSNKTLTARVKLDSSQAERKLKAIAKSIDAINRAAGQQSKAYQQVSSALRRSTATANQLNRATQNTANSSKKLNNNLNKSNTILGGMVSKMKRLATIYLGVMGARALFTTADTITASENRLNNSNASILGDDPSDGYSKETIKATEQAMNKMFAASQRARTGYADMMANVSKSMVLAGNAFDNNMDNAIAFQETMAKAYTVGGASAAEQASSMYQMIQALGSGVLQGDELRSVREGAPLAYKAIEQFAQGVYGTTESLKDMASQGLITSDIVVAAIQNASDSINDSFNASAMTWAQAWTYIKNVAVDAMRPVQDALNDFLSSDATQVLLAGIENVIRFLGAALTWVITILSNVINWFVENWYWIQWIVYAGLTIIIGKLAILAAQAIVTGAIMFFMMLEAMSPVAWIILLIGALISVLAYLGVSVQQIVGAIVAFLFGVASVVWNLFVTLVATIISGAVIPLTTAWDMFANFFANIFNDPIATIIRSFETLANAVLGILKTIASGIDAIFGSNLASAVSGWMSKVSGKADSLVAKYGNGSYEEKSDVTGKVNELLNTAVNKFTWDTGSAISTGYDVGSGAVDWVGNKLSGLTDKFTGKYGSESIGAYDPTVALNTTAPDLGNIAQGTSDTADNTGKIADSMELTQEDLEYLRKLAQLEWKKEYTSNQININMTNNNNVNSDSDLDGIVTKLTEKLYEELSTTASGVYA